MRLVRLDASSTAARGSVAELLAEFAKPGAAILLGTQMVAKGHDLPEVTVAAVLDADAGLRHADFRAEERAFDLIVQTAGRAGRRGEDVDGDRAGMGAGRAGDPARGAELAVRDVSRGRARAAAPVPDAALRPPGARC